MRCAVLLTGCLLSLAASAHAGDADGARHCIDPAGHTADEIAQCLDGVRAAADARLNATYRSALADLDGADGQGLRDAQRAWVAFRVKDRTSLLEGGWRAERDTYVRIAAAEADIAAINAREFELRVYPRGTSTGARP